MTVEERDRLAGKVLAGVQIGLGVVILSHVIEGRAVVPWMVAVLLLTIPPTILLRNRQRRRLDAERGGLDAERD